MLSCRRILLGGTRLVMVDSWTEEAALMTGTEGPSIVRPLDANW